jgi:TonB family protein
MDYDLEPEGSMKRRFLTLAIAFSLVQVSSLRPACAQQIIEQWQNGIRESSELLAAGNYPKSLKISNRIIDQMFDQLGPGEGETRYFAVVLVHKALGHAGLGQEKEAIWYWHMAVNLDPQLADTDLTKYGQAGAFLRNHPFVPWDIQGKWNGTDTGSHDGMVPRSIERAKVVKRVEVKFPPGTRTFALEAPLNLDVSIDENGKVDAARLTRAFPAATMSYAAFESVKNWRFQPATENGKPVKSDMFVAFKYKP